MKTLTDRLRHVAQPKTYGQRLSESYDDPKKIDDKSELYDYAEQILKQAHGDKFDKSKMKKMVDDLVDKHGDDKKGYSTIVGVLQSSVSETLVRGSNGDVVDTLRFSEGFINFLDACSLAEALVSLYESWEHLNSDTYVSKKLSAYIKQLDETVKKTYALAAREPKLASIDLPVEMEMSPEDVQGRRLSAVIKTTTEWNDLLKKINKVESNFTEIDLDMQLRALMLVFVDRVRAIENIVLTN